MAENTQSLHNEFRESDFDQIAETASQVREDIERFVEGFDVRNMAKRIEEFGQQNPIGLALSALVLGLAAGLLMRGQKRIPNS